MNLIQDFYLAERNDYQGTVSPAFADLAQCFSRLQHHRRDQGGAALAVYFQQQKVLDIYTGQQSSSLAWQPDTLAISYSTGKGVLATLAHILVSAGYLDYDRPIQVYWPEFAQVTQYNLKNKMTLRHILTHQTGLFDIRNMIQHASEMLDWSHMLSVMEQIEPRFVVGQGSAYQALSFGWLLGGVLEKATEQSLQALMQQYLVEPLELDGAYFGVPTTQLSRVAKPLSSSVKPSEKAKGAIGKSLQSQPVRKTKAQKSTQKFTDKLIQWSGQDQQDFVDAMIPKGMRDLSFYDDRAIQAIIPAANGAFTARSLAKIYAMLAQGGVWQGKTLIAPQYMVELTQIQSQQRDRVMPIPMQWRLGYHRVITLGKRIPQGFGHLGYNGSGAWCDPSRQLSFAYTHNFPVTSITGDYRLWGLTQEAIRCADAVLTGRKGWF